MLTFRDPLLRARTHYRSQIALIDGAVHLTYEDVWVRGQRLGGALASRDLPAGSRIAVLAKNSYAFAELYLTLPCSRYVLVPVNWRLSKPEIAYLLEDARPSALVTDWGPEALGRLADQVDLVIQMGDDYEDMVAAGPSVQFPTGVSEDEVAAIFYTGGTSGRSKGVVLTHRNILTEAGQMLSHCRLDSDDRWLIMGAMFHVSGCGGLLAGTWAGATHLVMPRFIPDAALDLIERERGTITFAVPTMLSAMRAAQSERPRDVTSLRAVGFGGSPMPASDQTAVRETFPGVELIAMYGSTEVAGIATVSEHHERLLGTDLAASCGRAALGTEIRIIGPDEQPIGPHEVGEICVRSPSVMSGYWNKQRETDEVLPDGFYRSGDLGYRDDDGLLYVVDRKKDMIITGGENVYSTEVEAVLATHPGVDEVAVIGLPDEVWGEKATAVVTMRDDTTADQLSAHCRAALANYKVPKEFIVFTEEFPKSPAGKVLKRTLREQVLERLLSP